VRRSAKGRHEYAFWREQAAREDGRLENRHYEHFFTGWFGLDRGFYAGKRVLDVGCGPRGSLEWADMAARRVGLDPLAKKYRQLGIAEQRMEYVAAPAETIPAEDGSFDVVTSFNALDHTDDPRAAAREMCRVLAPGGTLLLATDVNHEPTPMEPQTFGWEAAEWFAPPLTPLRVERLRRFPEGLFASMLANESVPAAEASAHSVLVGRFEKPPA
jgi:ubiquinone/menaquinone biosynthesis C-methylase UbiE